MLRKPKEFHKGTYKSVELLAVQSDITDETSEAIVNAANEHLCHGGGVAGAISSRGGYEVQAESTAYVRKHGPVDTGKVGVTGPGRLKCKFIIHAVGPVFHGGNHHEDELLYSAVYESFKKAHEMNLISISIPAISSGIFGFPKPRCAKIMIKAARNFIDEFENTCLKHIRFCNFDIETVELMTKELSSFLSDPSKEIVIEPFGNKIKRKSWDEKVKGFFSKIVGKKEEFKKVEEDGNRVIAGRLGEIKIENKTEQKENYVGPEIPSGVGMVNSELGESEDKRDVWISNRVGDLHIENDSGKEQKTEAVEKLLEEPKDDSASKFD